MRFGYLPRLTGAINESVALRVVLIALGILAASPLPARADCTGATNLVEPHSRTSFVEGGLVYDTTSDILKTCDGTNWNALASGGGLSGGTSGYLGVWTGATSLGLSSTSAGQQLFWDATNNRLGIGTTTPTYKLQVGDGSAADISLGFKGNVANTQSFIWAANDGRARFTQYADLDAATASDLLVFRSYGYDNQLVLKGNGNVGIGTANPTYHLQVESGADNQIRITGKGTGYGGTLLADIYSERTTAAPATDRLLRVGSAYAPDIFGVFGSGNVGIGTTAPIRSLHINGSGAEASLVLSRSDGLADNKNWRIFSQNSGAGTAGFLTIDLLNDAGTAVTKNVMNVLANGNVGIGASNPTEKLFVVGNIVAQNQLYDLTSNPQGGAQLCRNGTTGVHSACSSDRRLKKNIITIDETVLPKVLGLRPVQFDWINDPAAGREVGFIAQEVRELFPLTVKGDEAKEKLTFAPGNLVPYLVKAMQELKADNDNLRVELKAANDNHAAEIEELRHQIDALKAAR